jgi:hypothetical protein
MNNPATMNEPPHATPPADSNNGTSRLAAAVGGGIPAPKGFAVWDAENAAEHAAWTRLWNSSPTRDIFAHPSYVRLFRQPADRALCAAWESSQGKVLFPFLLRDLSAEPYCDADLGPACDLISPYGFGGAAFWGNPDPAILAGDFWKSFDAWASAQRVVSEFVRFSPFEEGLLPYPGVVCENRKMIVRDLRPPQHVIWREFAHNVHYNIRRAQRAGVQVRIDEHGESLAEFLRIYEHTMRRRDADPMFLFPPRFFTQIQRDLCGRFVYFHAVCAGRVLASELVLLSADAAYSYLGGTDSEAFRLGPNHLLKFEIMRWATAQGKQWFVLGGGHEPNDGIYQYKRGFAPGGVVSFRVGCKIRDEQRCNRLIEARRRHGQRAGRDWLPQPNFFPPYRA